VWWPASDESTPAYPENRVAGLVQQRVNQKESSRKKAGIMRLIYAKAGSV
jgi:hypothetical protein